MRLPRLILEKADWTKFYNCTEIDMTTVEKDMTVDELVEVFNRHMTEVTLAAIPRTSGRLMPQRVPW